MVKYLLLMCMMYQGLEISESNGGESNDLLLITCDNEINNFKYNVYRNDTDDVMCFIYPALNETDLDSGYFVITCQTGSAHLHCCSQDEYLIQSKVENSNYIDVRGIVKDSSWNWRQVIFSNHITVIYDRISSQNIGLADSIIA